MSALFRTRHRDTHRTSSGADVLLDDNGRSGRYLTDGVNLYRSLGAIVSGPCRMFGLENCHSLEVMLIAAEDLRSSRLRPVIPAAVTATAR